MCVYDFINKDIDSQYKGVKKVKKRECERTTEMRTGRIEDAMRRYGVGRDTMRKIARAAAAEIRVGRSYLINYSKVDAYMDSLSH